MEERNKWVELHTAGATVLHASPFESLPSHRNEAPLSPAFITQWVVPYYMKIGNHDTDWIDSLKKVKPIISKDICLSLLGEFNWRSRLVGAYFAAIKGYNDLIEIIGTH